MNIVAEKKRALALMHNGNFAKARNIFSELLQQENTDKADLHYQTSITWFKQGKVNEAEAALIKAIALDENNVDIQYALAGLYTSTNQIENAARTLQRTIEIDDEHTLAISDLGNIHLLKKDYETASQYFKRALSLNASHAPALYNMGLISARDGDIDGAQKYYNQAIESNPEFAEAHNNLANILYAKGEIINASEHYENAIALKPVFPDAHANLAHCLEKRHDIEKAKSHAAMALQQNPSHFGALILLVQICYRENKVSIGLQLANKMLDSGMDSQQRAVTLMEKGKLLDKEENYQDAFNAFSLAKASWTQHLKENQTSFTDTSDKIISFHKLLDSLSNKNNIFNDNQAEISARHAPVFIIGFPRSGTSLTEQIISTYDNIMATHERPIVPELIKNIDKIIGRNFKYPDDLNELNKNDIALLRDYYWSQVEDLLASDNTVLLDKLPLNIIDVPIINIIFPEARFITLIRDPRDACISCYKQSFQLNSAMSKFLDIDTTTQFYAEVMGLWNRYKETLPIQYIEIRYEDLVGDIEQNSKNIFGFIDKEWSADVLNFHENAVENYSNTPSYQAVIKPAYKSSINNWKKYEDQLNDYIAPLLPFIDQYSYTN